MLHLVINKTKYEKLKEVPNYLSFGFIVKDFVLPSEYPILDDAKDSLSFNPSHNKNTSYLKLTLLKYQD